MDSDRDSDDDRDDDHDDDHDDETPNPNPNPTPGPHPKPDVRFCPHLVCHEACLTNMTVRKDNIPLPLLSRPPAHFPLVNLQLEGACVRHFLG